MKRSWRGGTCSRRVPHDASFLMQRAAFSICMSAMPAPFFPAPGRTYSAASPQVFTSAMTGSWAQQAQANARLIPPEVSGATGEAVEKFDFNFGIGGRLPATFGSIGTFQWPYNTERELLDAPRQPVAFLEEDPPW